MVPTGGQEFRPVRHDIAPYKNFMGRWPKDNVSKLGTNRKLEFVDQVFGIDNLSRGPYTGVVDGWIVQTFMLITPNGVDSTSISSGRCTLWLTDGGTRRSIATPLATQVVGKLTLFANDLDIHDNVSIFFTDTSSRYESSSPRTESVEVVVDLPGYPDNTRLNDKGQFWVAIDCCKTVAQEVLTQLLDEEHLLQVAHQDGPPGENHGHEDVREANGKPWIGIVAHNHIAILTYP
ncbi:hypothetical protein MLD38_019664 [Melastoma candidum]|uniref:Uncharacterized protein n=1 Tax=Melastoma candidum TaxID=119954 RepID=A0ACB9QXS9_9MYRT|nr:hypothetical protein MLD38_019664 [Melastoma candidum]